MWHFAGHRRIIALNSFWDAVGIGSDFMNIQNALFVYSQKS